MGFQSSNIVENLGTLFFAFVLIGIVMGALFIIKLISM
jgi:hypothetical protein